MSGTKVLKVFESLNHKLAHFPISESVSPLSVRYERVSEKNLFTGNLDHGNVINSLGVSPMMKRENDMRMH